VWWTARGVMYAEDVRPTPERLATMKIQLLHELDITATRDLALDISFNYVIMMLSK
jgi:hypothetical protein